MLVSPYIRLGTVSSVVCNHYSWLATTENVFGVAAGNDHTAPSSGAARFPADSRAQDTSAAPHSQAFAPSGGRRPERPRRALASSRTSARRRIQRGIPKRQADLDRRRHRWRALIPASGLGTTPTFRVLRATAPRQLKAGPVGPAFCELLSSSWCRCSPGARAKVVPVPRPAVDDLTSPRAVWLATPRTYRSAPSKFEATPHSLAPSADRRSLRGRSCGSRDAALVDPCGRHRTGSARGRAFPTRRQPRRVPGPSRYRTPPIRYRSQCGV